jgi:branched-chain amino acid transport system substrate-binding protein
MRSWYPRLTCAAVALGTAAGLAACGSSASNNNGLSSARPIVIGTSQPLGGNPNQDPFIPDGQAFVRGYTLWANYVNSHGGLLGRQVKLIILDNKGSTSKVQADYRTLINKDHVNLVFGPFSTLLTAPTEQVVGPAGYALIEGAGGAPKVFMTEAGLHLHNVFDPSLPVDAYLNPLVQWIKSLTPSRRPKTAAYPSSNDPFTLPAVATAHHQLTLLGIKSLYYNPNGFTETPTEARKLATAIAALSPQPQIVILGSTAVSTVQAFMSVFEKQHIDPKIFLATSGPDQGQAFLNQVGINNANGVEVLGGWNASYADPLSNQMVEEYIAQYGAQYGATAAGINADVAEAYSVGEVAADAVRATGGTNQAKIISYLHSATLQTVQGSVHFKPDGENQSAIGFVFQWVNGTFVQVLALGQLPSKSLIYPKRPWGQ